MKGTILLVLAALVARQVSADDVVYSTTRDLPFDENGKLAKHVVAYPAGSSGCAASSLPKAYGFESRAVAGEALQAIFPGAKEGDCVAACLEKGKNMRTLLSKLGIMKTDCF